jgi:hypothetical protein
MIGRFGNSFLFAAALMLVCQAASFQTGSIEQERQFAKEYQELVAIQVAMMKQSAPIQGRREMQTIRDYFLKSGDAGARFLVEKLKGMDEDERRFLHGSTEFDVHVVEYMDRMTERGEPVSTKVAVVFILEDVFPNTSAKTQTEILEAIVASYTPSTYGGEDRGVLDGALVRIGPAGVPYLFQVADHAAPSVRCGAELTLSDIGKAAKDAHLPAPPILDCNMSDSERRAALKAWSGWWNANRGKFPFPKVPNLLDIPVAQGAPDASFASGVFDSH